MKIVILLGAPGSGKGTVAARLAAENANLKHVSSGDLLRGAVAKGTPAGVEAKKFMEAGQLVPDELIAQMIKDVIAETEGDVTMLLNAAVGAGTMCIHGPMAFQIANEQEPVTTITRNMLMGNIPQYKIASDPYNRCGHAEGILIGGNLSSYAAIAGTKFHLPLDQDIILFIEEVEEALHDIDRLFYTLRLVLDFERVKGIIFGTFSSIKFDLQFGSVEQMLIAHLHDLDIPVCCGFPVGSNSCLPLIEGAPCSLDVTLDKAILTFNVEGSVETYDTGKEQPQLLKPELVAI
jgi:muramoyltetrapeptide carboxypeptidase